MFSGDAFKHDTLKSSSSKNTLHASLKLHPQDQYEEPRGTHRIFRLQISDFL